MKFKLPPKGKPILTLQIYKRHILFSLIALLVVLFGYSFYFKFFMVLPQTAINVMPELPMNLENQKIMIFAPHCDDEVLGAGGLIHRAIWLKSQVRVVVVTDCNKRKIGQKRKVETKNGLIVVGLSAQNLSFLDFPEGESMTRKDPEDRLRLAMQKQIDSYKPTLVVMPNINDTHRDHKATGIAGDKILQNRLDVKVLYYLIHYNFLRFPSPPGLRPDDYLLPPARLINFKDKWYKFTLTTDEVDLKEEAIGEYKTQLSLRNPILTRILWDFARRNELFMMQEPR